MGEVRSIAGLWDACSVASGLRERFRRGHAAVMLAEDGRVLDLTMFVGRRYGPLRVLGWARDVIVNDPRVTHVVLLSVYPKARWKFSREDADMFVRTREVFADHGVGLLDWIQTDGDVMRVLSVVAGVETWTRVVARAPVIGR